MMKKSIDCKIFLLRSDDANNFFFFNWQTRLNASTTLTHFQSFKFSIFKKYVDLVAMVENPTNRSKFSEPPNLKIRFFLVFEFQQ